MKNKNLVIYSALTLILLFVGCSSVPKTDKEETQPTPKKTVVWENNDSQLISDSLISSALRSDWIKKFGKNRKPIVVVGRIENNTNENIDVSLLAKDIERSLINSGKISFIHDKQKRERIRTDRKNSSDFPTNKFKKYLKSLKADFFLEGNIELSVDSISIPIKKKYTLNLELLKTKNASVAWKDSQSITK